MKIAISLPDALGAAAAREAKRQKVSRSALVQQALRAFLAKNDDDLTARIDASLAKTGQAKVSSRQVARAWADLEW
jgi:metal-responsive CopG/Arc/MetJ family transcriptional regulator